MSDTNAAPAAEAPLASDQATSIDAIMSGQNADPAPNADDDLKAYLKQDAPPNPTDNPFLKDISDPDLKGYLERKGFKDTESLAKSFVNAERALSRDAAGRITPPTGPDDVEGYDRVFKALGRPEKPEDYGLTQLAGADEQFASNAAKWLFDAGVTTPHAAKLADAWNNYVSEQATKADAEFQAKSNADWAGIRSEWGGRFEEGVEQFRRGAVQFGLTAEDMGAIERQLGTAKTVRTFAKIGAGLAEDKFIEGEGRSQFSMTPDQAKARIAAMQGDTGWQERWANGGVPEKEELARLNAVLARAAA